MKRFIFGLILMFTFSFVGNSFGFAIPDDAKIEKVFKQDVEKVSVDAISVDVEKLKIADSLLFRCSSGNLPTYNGKFIYKFTRKPIHLHRRQSLKMTNYNKYYTKTKFAYIDLPIKVGWRK